MSLNTAQLTELVEQGQVDECVAFFAHASENDRQGVAKLAEKWLRKNTEFVQTGDSFGAKGTREQIEAGRVTAFAACSFSTIKSLGWRISPVDDPVIRVLAARQPKWLDEYAEHLLEGDAPQWISVRRMMKGHLCSKPKHDNYVLGMTHHSAGVGGSASDPTEHQGRTWSNWNILTHLEAEPDLLEDVWRLFEIEGGGEYSLAAHDKYSRQSVHRWDEALKELSVRGVLSRERLLDASLAALDRGFAQFRAGWFSAFHELLSPTPDERIARQDRYLQLIRSHIPPTVTFALHAIEIIDQHQPLSASLYMDAMRPVMMARAKGTVKSGLKTLDILARREPEHANLAARVAAEALIHEASDVQLAVLKLIASHGTTADAELVTTVKNVQRTVAASVRRNLSDWLATEPRQESSKPESKKKGMRKTKTVSTATSSTASKTATTSAASSKPTAPDPDNQQHELEQRAARLPAEWREIAGVDRALAALKGGKIDLTGCTFDGTEFPRLDLAKAISPIETLDELIDVVAHLIEKPDDYDAVERVFDGISRLCDERPDDFEKRTAPLLKRIRQLMKRNWVVPFAGTDPTSDLIGVVLAWIVGEYGTYARSIDRHGNTEVVYTFRGETRVQTIPETESAIGTMSERARQLADRVVERKAVQTLCAPTHTGGWIDPCVLAERAREVRLLDNSTDIEQVLALLRLAPDRRPEAVTRLPSKQHAFLSALRGALGEKLTKSASRSAGLTDWLSFAMARARSPWESGISIENEFPHRGPDAGEVGVPRFRSYVDEISNAPKIEIDVQPSIPPDAIDPRLLGVLLWKRNDRNGWPQQDSVSVIQQLFSIRPIAQEAVFARGVYLLGHNLGWWEAQWPNRHYLEPLLDPDSPLRSMGLLLLVLGLGAKEPGEHGLATDAAIAAIEDGRLAPHQMGTVMNQLMSTGFMTSARWAKTLGQVTRVSPLHENFVRIAISHSLRGDPKAMPKDLHALVELLKELVVESNARVDEETRTFLSQLVGSSKLGKAAKVIVGITTEAVSSRNAETQRLVLEQRIDRVERWMARE